MSVEPWSATAFEDRYRRDDDPWDFRTSSYEQARYEQVIAALRRDRYPTAFEPGCSVGELTWRLAARCEQVRAVDVSPTAIAAARERCRGLTGVQLAVGSVADHPLVDHDLIVLSEVGYYFTEEELDGVVDRLVGSLRPDGDLVACHWSGHSADHRLHGTTVHERIARHRGLRLHHERDHQGFAIATWVRR